MADINEEAAESLRSVESLRTQTRLVRSGHWFVSIVFGIVTLGAMPFYFSPVPSATTPGCRIAGPGLLCVSNASSAPLGRALNPMDSFSGLARWATLYWVVAVVLGFAVVVTYYRRRARSVGVQSRLWPAVAVGVGLLALVVLANGEARAAIPDFWIRGTGALLIIAIGISVLAVLERSRPFGVFAAGFLALSLLSCLYDDVNILQRVGLAGPFQTSANALPNLLLPGVYLVLGGIGFLLARGWTFDVRVRRSL